MVTDKDVIVNRNALTNKCMGLYPDLISDDNPLLYLHKRPDHTFFTDSAAVQIDKPSERCGFTDPAINDILKIFILHRILVQRQLRNQPALSSNPGTSEGK